MAAQATVQELEKLDSALLGRVAGELALAHQRPVSGYGIGHSTDYVSAAPWLLARPLRVGDVPLNEPKSIMSSKIRLKIVVSSMNPCPDI
jgi:hypothetical protein